MRVEILFRSLPGVRAEDRIMLYADTAAGLINFKGNHTTYFNLSRGQNNLRKLIESNRFKVSITRDKKSPIQLKVNSIHIIDINYHS